MTLARNLFLFFFIMFLINSSCKKEESISTPGVYFIAINNHIEHAFLNNDTTGVAVHVTSPYGDEHSQSTVLQDNDYIFTRFSEDPNHLIMFYSNRNGKFLNKADFDNEVVWSERVKFIDSDRGDIRDLKKIGTSYYCLGDHGWQPDGLSVIKYDESGKMLFHKNLLFDSKNIAMKFISLN